jgi:hypothetical protein
LSDPAEVRCASCAAPREIVNGVGADRCPYCGMPFSSPIVTPNFAGNLGRLESRVGSIDERLARLTAPGHAAIQRTSTYSPGLRLLVAMVAAFFFCPIGMLPAMPFLMLADVDPNNLIFATFTTGVLIVIMLLSSMFALTLFASIVSGNTAPLRGYGYVLRAIFEGIGRFVLGIAGAVRPKPGVT